MELEKDYKNVNYFSSSDLYSDKNERTLTSSPIGSIQNKLKHNYLYRPEEVGMSHPVHPSVVKLKNNGDIDMYVGENTGITINKKLQTIAVYANKLKQNLHSSHRWIESNDNSYIKGNQYTRVVGDVTLDADGHLHVTIDKDGFVDVDNLTIHVRGNADVKVDGNVNANIGGHAKIEMKGNLTARSNGNIDLEAKGYFRADGSRVFLGREAF